ncbi:MAG: hypothetical protein C0483_05510 [Pirellula sp.]|nr:hypothetical protein [Pirellula sp.]
MTHFRLSASLLCALFASILGSSVLAGDHEGKPAPFRAAAATSNLTPAIGGDIIGGFSPSPSKHIHDELHARCLVLDDGKTKLALVVCDLLGVHKLISDEARRIIEERTGIPRANVLISATHTHSASSALGNDRYVYAPEMDEYQKFVARRIADGVQRCVNTLRPAELAYGSVDIPEHVFNRRWFLRPGTMPPNPFGGTDLVKMNPGAGNPNLVEPAGPTDPTVSFVAVREPGGKPIGLFAAYSLHYVGGVSGAAVSADYFGMFAEEMKKLLTPERQDPPFVAMMANGTSGDINNINFRNPRGKQGPYEQMQIVADDVAKKVQLAMKDLTYRSDLTLDARYSEPTIAWRRPTEDQIAWAKKVQADKLPEGRETILQNAYAKRTLALAEYPAEGNLPVQALRIGDVCIGTMPCEVFCEIGLDFRKRSPIKNSFLVSLAHGYYGYLPTPRHHDLGGYETWLGTNRVERTASEKFTKEVLRLAGEMKP